MKSWNDEDNRSLFPDTKPYLIFCIICLFKLKKLQLQLGIIFGNQFLLCWEVLKVFSIIGFQDFFISLYLSTYS